MEARGGREGGEDATGKGGHWKVQEGKGGGCGRRGEGEGEWKEKRAGQGDGELEGDVKERKRRRGSLGKVEKKEGKRRGRDGWGRDRAERVLSPREVVRAKEDVPRVAPHVLAQPYAQVFSCRLRRKSSGASKLRETGKVCTGKLRYGKSTVGKTRPSSASPVDNCGWRPSQRPGRRVRTPDMVAAILARASPAVAVERII